MAEDWSDETGPEVLLRRLREKGPLTVRKLRLWGSACVRRAWHLLHDPASRAAVEAIERYVDGEATWRAAFDAAVSAHGVWEALCEGGRTGAAMSAAEAATAVAYGHEGESAEPRVTKAAESAAAAVAFSARRASPAEYDAALEAERAVQCDLLHCVFGDPSHPVTLDPSCLTPPVLALAATVYEHRSFDRLPELARALADAGCTDAELLGHLRSAGPHFLGCWGLDAVLGKA
jgi:hypothetical protein